MVDVGDLERRRQGILHDDDSINDLSDPRNLAMIWKKTDGFGNVFFTRTGLREAQLTQESLRELRNRIVPQRNAFNQLPEEERTRLTEEFESSKGQSEAARPFTDHLRSEALGRRFADLQRAQQARQNPSR